MREGMDKGWFQRLRTAWGGRAFCATAAALLQPRLTLQLGLLNAGRVHASTAPSVHIHKPHAQSTGAMQVAAPAVSRWSAKDEAT